MTAAAWLTAAAYAALLAFYLVRGRMGRRLSVDALAVGVALGAAVAAALAPFELRANPLHFSAQTLAFLFAGGPEEAVKMIGVAAFLKGHWRARGAHDVVFAGGALALGFAALENAFYLAGAGSGWATLALERALTATPFHVFTGLAGAYVVATRPAWALPAWAGLAAIHGAYDFAVFAGAPATVAPEFWRRAVAATGLNGATALRALLAGSEAAAALAALAAVTAAPRRSAGRLAGALGFALICGSLLALGAGALAAFALATTWPLLAAALYAVAPLTLGLMFWRERAAMRARTRRVLTGIGLAAGLAAAGGVFWQWRALEAQRFEARGAWAAASGDAKGALEALDRAVTVAPERVEARVRRAGLYAAAKRYDEARADLDAALRRAPDDVALYVARADIDRQRNAYAAVVTGIEAALRLRPEDPELLAIRAQGRLESGDSHGAYGDLAMASRKAPNNALVRRVFAAWDVDAGDFDAGLRDLNARLHDDPADASAAFQRGRAWLYKGDDKRAAEDFARADRDAEFLYPALWRFLAGDGAALRARLTGATGKWPAPAARLLLGEIDLDAARALARDDGERCEADFYFAMSRRSAEPRDATAARLTAALGECPRGYIEYEGAKAILRRLGR